MPINPTFKIQPKPTSGKIGDITKEFKITKCVKKVGSVSAHNGGKSSGGKTWKQRHY